MKFGFPALVFVVAIVACTDLASALDASLVSAESPTTSRQDASQISNAPRNVAASASCREVDVALDEGYEISSHETRYQCDERVP
ncbi:hypothetical protein [Methylocystis heyeri]|uniref:Uncharacterized protein n=1 Tax=Methylocystis heyeri TaxID=391905 RepID=A0A6B8KCW2_9HYPH|nr:hypothetical protein [Methylocystis heyeri]QGM44253.1 hypothetical protein H2LOC_000235 [Methylocystis heyeri]